MNCNDRGTCLISTNGTRTCDCNKASLYSMADRRLTRSLAMSATLGGVVVSPNMPNSYTLAFPGAFRCKVLLHHTYSVL